MSKKTYRVKEDWKDYEVILEVDHDLLTPELATQINQFWNDDDERLEAENGNPVKAVIRLAGTVLMQEMLAVGGASFSKSDDNSTTYWAEWLASQEGWPPLEVLGIRCIDADVLTPDFEDVELTEITA
ncbi:DUF2528 family protein [Rheinheimera faecalis]|uniref:DUF2528 family protein n=1 Tax=Rheinheimera faecalis TaxID=2901141 RepID=UPI001E399AC7|nr:DUF2528 family protein [Rheinheimera faecalis]